MLALTKKTGYALMAMTHLAGLPEGGLASARRIARQVGAPTALMMNVLKSIAAAGYVDSVRGAQGGYRLARALDGISLKELVDVIEGPLQVAECVTDQAGQSVCDMMDRCPIYDPVHRLQRKLRDFLKTVTLAEIVNAPAAQAAGKGTKRP